MTLIKKNKQRLLPWGNMLLKDFLSTDDFFNDDFFEEDSLMPAMNVKETKDNFIVELAAPGFSKKDFDISLDENMLHVSANKSSEKIDEDKDAGYTRKEFSYNSFKRSLQIPKAINRDDEVKATYKHGILEVTLNKKEEAKRKPAKHIEVA